VPELRVDVSDLKSESDDLIKELVIFLEEEANVKVETIANEIIDREIRLTMLQALKLKLLGEVKVFNGRPEDWTGALGEVPFYVTKCPRHGYYLAYHTGFKKELRCPSCLQELVEASGIKRR